MFWKRKTRVYSGQLLPSVVTRALERANGKLICWASSLQRQTSKLSSSRLKGLLCLFCISFVSASTYVIINSFGVTGPTFRVTPIQAMLRTERTVNQSIISEGEFKRLHRLRVSLDSLAASPTGRVVFDSLVKKHPNLMDTLKLLENIYFEHKK